MAETIKTKYFNELSLLICRINDLLRCTYAILFATAGIGRIPAAWVVSHAANNFYHRYYFEERHRYPGVLDKAAAQTLFAQQGQQENY